MQKMIEVRNLTKVYNTGKGIFNIDFQVHEGEVFGFLGPNGAGKTTTIRQLLGFTNADSGECLINGMESRQNAHLIEKNLGYLPGEIAFFDKMSGTDFLDFIASLRGIKNPSRKQELIERYELEADRKISKMSKGMKQKVALVAAFMHDPQILILDEPTSGLDPLMQKRFIDMILEEKKRGKTIFMSSHLFEEVERTSDRVAIIKEGKLVAVESVVGLKAGIRKTYIVKVASVKDAEIIKSSLTAVEIGNLSFEIHVSDDYKKLFAILAKCDVKSFVSADQSLEQIFINYYGKQGD
jgi:ABC-2 type transport system ATP-binding protein